MTEKELEIKIKSSLNIGQEFKNVMELLRYVGLINPNEKTIKGTQRIKLINTISSYINYEYVKGNTIRIIDIYNEPLEIIDKRHEGIYVTFIESVLLDYLIKQDGYTVDMSNRTLFETLGMVNNNYFVKDYRKRLKDKDDSISNFEQTNFFTRSYSFIKKTVERALNSLNNKSAIYCQKNIIIESENYYSNNIENHNRHIATDDEIECILGVEQSVLQEFKVTGKSQIFMQGRSVDFYNRVKEILLAEYNWCNYYEEFHIVLGKKANLKNVLDNNLAELSKISLNQTVIESVNKDAENRYKRQEERWREEWEEAKSKGEYPNGILAANADTYVRIMKDTTPHYGDDYVDTQKLLAKYFLSIVPQDQKTLLEYINNRDKND